MKYFQLLIVTITLYYYSCLLSFSPHAPSPFSVTLPEAAIETHSGKWGSLFVGATIYYLGLGAYVLPIIPLIYSVLSAIGYPLWVKLWKVLLASVLFALAVSQVLDSLWPTLFVKQHPIASAGSIGAMIRAWTQHNFGSWGTLSLIVVSLALGSIMLISKQKIEITKNNIPDRDKKKEQSADGF